MYELILLILGLGGLWLGAELIVRGSQNIARFFKISELFIGLTIVSIGTSLPEIAVSIAGGFQRLTGVETSGIVVGNAVGSCLNQISIILGIVGLVGGILLITKRELRREGLMLLGSIAIFFVFSFDGVLTKFEGAVMIIIYIIYFISLFREEKIYEKIKRPQIDLLWDIVSIVAGLLLIIYASKVVVGNGVSLAHMWGVKESLIGILLVGLGTGLPELAVSLTAIARKSTAIAVGNIIGSNICDLLFSLGLGTMISGFIVNHNLIWFDIPIMFGIALIVLLLFNRSKRLKRKEAIILIALYIIYLAFKLKGF